MPSAQSKLLSTISTIQVVVNNQRNTSCCQQKCESCHKLLHSVIKYPLLLDTNPHIPRSINLEILIPLLQVDIQCCCQEMWENGHKDHKVLTQSQLQSFSIAAVAVQKYDKVALPWQYIISNKQSWLI